MDHSDDGFFAAEAGQVPVSQVIWQLTERAGALANVRARLDPRILEIEDRMRRQALEWGIELEEGEVPDVTEIPDGPLFLSAIQGLERELTIGALRELGPSEVATFYEQCPNLLAMLVREVRA